MPIRKIAILVHERHRDAVSTAYRIWSFAAIWREHGIIVEPVLGIEKEIDADLLIPHLDLSYIPDDYWAFIQRHPNVVNRAVRDIRKSAISANLVQLADSWQGPVIVKTDRNYRGAVDDQLLGQPPTLARRALGRIARAPWVERRVLGWRTTPHRYHIFRTKNDVPRRVWTNRALVVERFLPDRQGDLYAMHMWTFFGSRGHNRVYSGPDPWIKGHNAEMRAGTTPPPPTIMEVRHRLGLDYAKIDWVMHEGKAALLDVSLTPGFRAPTQPDRVARSVNLSEGLAYFGSVS